MIRQSDQLQTIEPIRKIGSGQVGGKAQGLIFISEHLSDHFKDGRYQGIKIRVPSMTVITTDFFDAFMTENDLFDTAYSDMRNDRIAAAFQRANIPFQYVGELRSLSDHADKPLAVRSSSLLEDALNEPFAGVYQTKMIPNNQPSADERFRKLIEAIKFVLASTFFSEAKRYIKYAGKKIEIEKMAVIVQEVVGNRHNDNFYPEVSGVARSRNFYPFGHATPQDGVVDLALGMGKTIADGGTTWSYSPAYPKSPPPYNNTRDMLKNTQTSLWAVNMGSISGYDPLKETEYMVKVDLEAAHYDDTLKYVASTYDSHSDRIVPGVGVNGPRLLNFAPILSMNDIPLNDLLIELLKLCKTAYSAEVDIEFAVTIGRSKDDVADLGFLQVRPMISSGDSDQVPMEWLSLDNAVIASEQVLGSSSEQGIIDVVYVLPDHFKNTATRQIAKEIESMNADFVDTQTPYVLIGFGRWGTSDSFCGIPVTWDQISAARVIVEALVPGLHATMSQGSHFFHNLSSFKVSYFSVPQVGLYRLNFDWLDTQTEIQKTQFVRHVRLARPLDIKVDTETGRGVILHNEG